MRHGIITAIAALLITAAYAQPATKNYPSFAPQNDLYIGADEKSNSQVTEADFNWIVDTLEDLYGPIFKARGGTLKMIAKWKKGSVNAFTLRRGSTWEVHLFGGLARMNDMTVEGFASVVCHEFGHQVGGRPKKTSGNYHSAVEGQSDYFATAKCLKHFFQGQPNREIIETMDIPEIVTEKCSEVYSSEEKQAICIRSAIAGESLGKVLAKIGRDPIPSLSTPSKDVAETTIVSGYPSSQCRVDTFFQGALCDKSRLIKPSNEDTHKGYCARENGYTIGARPLCWFQPNDLI
ncbi:MAG: hypothetical protein KAG61_10215 [Bacteriovoracaceae bacterium]|nr:hypothetical protein [Bacteriovoracaceae bacterium]